MTATDPYTQETLEALSAPACIVAPYPKVIHESHIDPEVEETFALIDNAVHAVRNIRAEMQLPPNAATDLYIFAPKTAFSFLEQNQTILKSLVRLHQVHFHEEEKLFKFSSTALVGSLKLVIPLPEEMREKEKNRLVKERDKLLAQQASTATQLSNPDFVAKAPLPLVEKLKANLAQSQKELVEISKKLEEFS
jgi:valyl-tRNA synthetase